MDSEIKESAPEMILKGRTISCKKSIPHLQKWESIIGARTEDRGHSDIDHA